MEGAFREVARLDPQRTEAWVMLVRIAGAAPGENAALRVLAEALTLLPDDPTLVRMQGEFGPR